MRALAARQLGHVTRAQLLELGATPGWLRSQMGLGWLIRVHAGVYALGHVPRHAHARAVAAVLACGEGAALSHVAAAALWGVLDWPSTLEVTARWDHRRPGIRTHRSSTLTARELRVHQGVRVTAPVRTVLDLQTRLSDAGLVRLVNELRLAGHLRPDALYPEARLIVEVDSWRYHADRAAFERDRAQDATALALAYRTLRVTERRLARGGEEEARTIRRILAL